MVSHVANALDESLRKASESKAQIAIYKREFEKQGNLIVQHFEEIIADLTAHFGYPYSFGFQVTPFSSKHVSAYQSFILFALERNRFLFPKYAKSDLITHVLSSSSSVTYYLEDAKSLNIEASTKNAVNWFLNFQKEARHNKVFAHNSKGKWILPKMCP